MPFARVSRVVLAVGLAVLLGSLAVPVRADTILNSGTTTVSTGTNFGGDLYIATTGTATLNVIAGGYATNTTGYLGTNAGSVGTATVSSGTWANNGELFVGYSGTGTLNVTGGSVTNLDGYLGYDMDSGYGADSVGTATVASGTWANNGDLFVGNMGTGTLNVTGGSVTNLFGVIGDRAGSVGTATASSGTWANSGWLYVGNSGTGTLNVTGGSVTNSIGLLGASGGNGIATVSSGTWANRSGLYVGYGGIGTLNVTGGSVTNSNGYLGNNAGSVGTATVSSGTWANSGEFHVGYSGTGTLNVNGGDVRDMSGYLGTNAGSVGTVTVSSGKWANSSNLYVGGSGTGTLNLNGGIVSVGGTLTRGTYGTINLNSHGTLQIGVGGTTGVLDVSTLTNNGTLIFNRSDAYRYSGIISGTGAVTKQEAGTLTLDGANTYTGLTTISVGTLQIGSGSTTGSIAGNVVNNSSLIFNRSDTSTYSGMISGTGAVSKQGAGTLTLSGNNSYTGGTNLSAGVLAVGGTSALGTGPLALNGGTLRAASGGGSVATAVSLNANTTIDGSDALTIGGNVTLNGFNTLTFNNTAQTTISGQIGESSTSILIKLGNGELQLTGANSYTGGTLVQSGTVRINNTTGSAFGAGAVTAASGATLTGSGIISGAVQMNGTWAPGNSPGLVTVNSNVVLNGILDMELGGVLRATPSSGGAGYYDAINVLGGLTIGGTLNVVLSNDFVPSFGDSFEILQYGQLSGDFGTVNYPALSGRLSWERTISAVSMTITVVPEPSTYAISAIASAGLASLMRRRKRPTRERSLERRTRGERSTHAGQGIARCSAQWCFWAGTLSGSGRSLAIRGSPQETGVKLG